MILINTPLTNLEKELLSKKTNKESIPCYLKMYIEQENLKFKKRMLNIENSKSKYFSWGDLYDFDTSPINQFNSLSKYYK